MNKADYIISAYSTIEEYRDMFDLPIGSIIRIKEGDSQYETILSNIAIFLIDSLYATVLVYPCVPGSKYYTIYGDSHLILTNKISV